MKKNFILLFVALSMLLPGCERKSRDFAAKKAPTSGAVEYTTEANKFADAGTTTVAELTGPAKIDGAALFGASCAACHQITGQGLPGVFPPLNGSPYVQSDKTDRMATIMIYGLSGPITVLGNQFNNVMAPLGGTFNDEQLAAIATFVRSSWSNKAGPVDASVFAEVRKKYGQHSFFSIGELGEEK